MCGSHCISVGHHWFQSRFYHMTSNNHCYCYYHYSAVGPTLINFSFLLWKSRYKAKGEHTSVLFLYSAFFLIHFSLLELSSHLIFHPEVW